MKQTSVRTTRALGLTASLIGVAAQNAGAAAIDAAPGFFFGTLPFNDDASTVGANNDISMLPIGVSNYTRVEGPDVFYRFVVTGTGTMTFTVTPAGPGEYDPSIYLLAGGNTGASAILGKDSAFFNNAESFTTAALNPGTYYFVVDSYYSSTETQAARRHGAYSLNVTGTAQLDPVPEPGTAALALGALGGVAWRRRRRGAR